MEFRQRVVSTWSYRTVPCAEALVVIKTKRNKKSLDIYLILFKGNAT